MGLLVVLGVVTLILSVTDIYCGKLMDFSFFSFGDSSPLECSITGSAISSSSINSAD